MRYGIENNLIMVEIDSFGAEVRSLKRKSDDKEYMWQADPKYWGRTSPVLFPFVGAVRNKTYTHDGISYEMGQHGFARDMEFTLISQEDDSILFELKSADETIRKYPFCFCLQIGYKVEETGLLISWKVINEDVKGMYFSIGAHPAFLCPINGENDKNGYGLKFKGLKNELHHHGNTPEGLAIMNDEVLKLDEGTVRFTDGFFDKCTYFVEGKQTDEVSLITPDGKPYVTVKFDTPLFAIWSPERKNAPFVCIEPWYGRTDAVDFTGELKDRDYEMKLLPGEEFNALYMIEIEKAE